MIDRTAPIGACGLSLCAALFFAAPTLAQTPPQPAAAQPAASAWSFSLGAGAMVAPRYEGSDRLAVGALPLAEISWKDRIFLSSSRGLGGYIVSTDAFKLSAAVGYDGGRDEKDGKRKSGKPNLLRGLGDIDASAVLNLSAEYEYSFFTAGLTASRYIGGSDGFTMTASLGAKVPVTDRLALGLDVHSTWADSAYMGDYFGISAGQSRRSGRAKFNAEAGIKDVGATLTAIYKINDSMSLMLSGGLSRLIGDAGKSPVVAEKNQPSGMLGLSYRF